jgi:hypothetical protein
MRVGGIDPATRTFQALRIALNDELGEIDRLFASLPRIVAVGGVAAIISFHSLEDRRAKQCFGDRTTWEPLTKKPVLATDAEREANPRAGSAKLRAARLLWVGAGVLFPLVTWATARVAPELPGTAAQRPLVWFLAALVAASAAVLTLGLVRGRPGMGFVGSAGTLFTLLGTGAAARWPVLLRSSLAPSLSIDAFNAATTHHGLRVALSWTLVGLPLACGYFLLLARLFRGKVRLEGH